MKKTKNLYLRVVDLTRGGGAVVRKYKFRYIPYFILIGPDGKTIIGRGGSQFFYQKIRNWNKQKWYKKYEKQKKSPKDKKNESQKDKKKS